MITSIFSWRKPSSACTFYAFCEDVAFHQPTCCQFFFPGTFSAGVRIHSLAYESSWLSLKQDWTCSEACLACIIPYIDALQIPRLDTRRRELSMKTFEKIAKTNNRLNHLLPPTREVTNGRTLRNKDCLSLPKCRTNRYKNSFIPAMCFESKNKLPWYF